MIQPSMKKILKQLTGGDFRSIGASNKVVQAVLSNPKLFASVFPGFFEADPLVRMRAADAVEKITKTRPELLRRFKKPLLDRVAMSKQQEVQWHVAQMLPRLELTESDMVKVRSILDSYLNTAKSNIVRVMSLQALADLTLQGKLGKGHVINRIKHYSDAVNTPSVRARSRKLLKQLGET